MATGRPTVSVPPRGSIFDDIVDGKRGGGEPAVAPATPAVSPAPPAAVAPAAPVRNEPAEPTKPAAAAPRPRAAAAAPPRRSRAGRRAGGSTSAYVGVPDMPADFSSSRKPLQVYIEPGEHWALKQQTFARGVDMSWVVAALVGAFNTDPDLWLRLIDQADDDRTTLGELIGPALRAAETTA